MCPSKPFTFGHSAWTPCIISRSCSRNICIVCCARSSCNCACHACQGTRLVRFTLQIKDEATQPTTLHMECTSCLQRSTTATTAVTAHLVASLMRTNTVCRCGRPPGTILGPEAMLGSSTGKAVGQRSFKTSVCRKQRGCLTVAGSLSRLSRRLCLAGNRLGSLPHLLGAPGNCSLWH